MLTQEEVKHIADLARIELTEEEEKKHQEQLGRILDYVSKLAEAKTEGVALADGGTIGLENVWRADEQPTANSQQQTINNKQQATDLIKMAPETGGEQVKVKNVF